MQETAEFFRIRDSGPWGDYGVTLWHGISVNMDIKGPLEMMRTGPYCPPVALTQRNLVLTQCAKDEFILLFGGDYTVGDVIVKKIVLLDWLGWDRASKYPPVEPGGDNEPEDYLFNREHDNTAASQVGELFHIVPEIRAFVEIVDVPVAGKRFPQRKYTLVKETWTGVDFFLGSGYSPDGTGPYCTGKMKVWIEHQCGPDASSQFFRFEPCEFR